MQKISRIDQIGRNGGEALHYDAKPECKHVWINYMGSKYRECHDCKKRIGISKEDDFTAYKRKSTI